MTAAGSGAALRALLEAYGNGDLNAVEARLAEDIVADVTTADGGADRVEGHDAFIARVPDLRAARGSPAVTQVLEVDDRQAIAMVEIRAFWMVEARPAHSDAFWSRAGAEPS